jgi:nitrate reductase NapD
MSAEQISGLLVHAMPDEVAPVCNALNALPGVDVDSNLGDGRLVVIVENTGERAMADTFAEIRNVEGVLSASLTYHFADDSVSLDEELP